jgi:ABC-2 type transport system ATP-binding protein
LIPGTRRSENAIIHVRHLVYAYPGIRALDDVSLTIPDNTITALVGPNGAGKTTLLRCLAALDRPFSGRVRVGGLNTVESPREIHRIVGYLPDFFGLYDRLTVGQALRYFAMAQKVASGTIPERVKTVMDRMDLAGKADARLGNLSRGMRQRLAIGQALVHDPKILLLDEPASGLDPEAREALAGLLLELRDDGKSIVVSSHILAELDRYAENMLVLRGGRLVESVDAEGRSAAGRTLCVESLDPVDPVVEVLAGVDGVREVTRTEGKVAFRFDGGDADRAALLRRMVDTGARITAFFERSEGVQERYLKTIRGAGED